MINLCIARLKKTKKEKKKRWGSSVDKQKVALTFLSKQERRSGGFKLRGEAKTNLNSAIITSARSESRAL